MKTINLALGLAVAALLTTAAMAQEQIPGGEYVYEGAVPYEGAADYGYEEIDGGYGGGAFYGGNYYYHTSWGRPVAQLVPPTANLHISYSRTVGGTTVNPIYSQFWGPNYGMEMYGGDQGMYRPTPYWPTSTSQFGVYYIRGPW